MFKTEYLVLSFDSVTLTAVDVLPVPTLPTSKTGHSPFSKLVTTYSYLTVSIVGTIIL